MFASINSESVKSLLRASRSYVSPGKAVYHTCAFVDVTNDRAKAKHIVNHVMLAARGNFFSRLIIGFFHVEMRKV
jgi:hypothetical protein